MIAPIKVLFTHILIVDHSSWLGKINWSTTKSIKQNNVIGSQVSRYDDQYVMDIVMILHELPNLRIMLI